MCLFLLLSCTSDMWASVAEVEIWATSWENMFMIYANDKGADQPAHPRSLISTFVVRCLESIIPLLTISKYWRLKLNRPVCVLTGRKPRRRFCHEAANFSSLSTTLILSLTLSDLMTLWRAAIRPTAWRNQQKDLCAQRRLRSACESVQSDPSLRWAHKKICWYCHAAGQLYG